MYKEVDFLQFVVEWMVNNTDKIEIERIEDELWVLLSLRVDKEDMWIIIWKWWNTINALRSLLRIMWSKIEKKINLKVLD